MGQSQSTSQAIQRILKEGMYFLILVSCHWKGI
jgi:hypothetical protein